jgi:hypothetical protein
MIRAYLVYDPTLGWSAPLIMPSTDPAHANSIAWIHARLTLHTHSQAHTMPLSSQPQRGANDQTYDHITVVASSSQDMAIIILPYHLAQ